ncbi:MAG: S46 family peptidase [Alistipes sp.]|nr:S46 family peptidase [Alistipes sp.]
MKKVLFMLALLGTMWTARADEGMWLLPYLQKMNIKQMRAEGCRLTAEDIYSMNNSSLKDAIIVFGGGCTGEIVSDKGLIFTNHHCGYGSIQQLSSVEHDYLKYGFWASSYDEELPVPGLTVRFVRSIEDVTAQIAGNVPSTSGEAERSKIVGENIALVTKELETQNKGMSIQVLPFFGGNQYFAFVMEVFRDVRLVGTPPSSIGNYGGDTDNWMWPRHTGDFSVFRVYADKDNRPAEYSKENRPYEAPRHLEISLDGVRENDFAMVMGFPGSTERYMTSYEIDQTLEVSNPQRIFIRGERQEIMRRHMEASDEVRIKYASKYAGSSNYWKNSIGMSRGLERLNVRAKKQAEEEAFQKWADANTLPEEGYMEALPKIREAIENITPAAASQQYLQEAFLSAVEIIRNAAQDLDKERLEEFFGDYDTALDHEVARRMFRIARENMKPEDLPSVYKDVIDARFGGDTDAYVDWLYETSAYTSLEKALTLTDETRKQDPAYELAKSVIDRGRELSEARREWTTLYNEGHRLYIAGLMRMQPDRAWYPDANFTIRLTYGQVLPYDPADAVTYNYFTTLEGVLAKEDPENPTEFTVEEKLKELYRKKDYGRYADADGRIHTCFLANLDITGGNSGSPVLDGRGRLIGLAFDGNWEAMSGDIAFEPELQRCIAVDIRYVLFIIDKYAGCKHIIDELDIAPVKSRRK